MLTSTGIYSGNLRTEARHERSGNTLITDAPLDNNGRGEAFSPTDLVATALGSCMATIMGIRAEREGIDLSGLRWQVTKHMSTNAPRRITAIDIHLEWDGAHAASPEQRAILKKAALTCPVAESLHQDIQQNISFNF